MSITNTKKGDIAEANPLKNIDKREEAKALVKLVDFAKSDISNGRVMSSDIFKARLLQRKESLINGNFDMKKS